MVGNMLTKGSTAFTWTQGRRLASVNNGKNIQYAYDHTGNRVKKTVNGTVTEYHLAGKLILSETTGNSTQLYRYDSSGKLFAATIGGNIYFYLHNLQGDVIGLVNANGSIVAEYKYDSWGNLLNKDDIAEGSIAAKNPFRYRGYYYDVDTEMYYVSSRYYDPEIRRFISADGIVSGKATNTRGCNVFSYCFNNPVNMSDDNGDWAKFFKKVGQTVSKVGKSIAKGVVRLVYTIGKSVNIEVGAGLGLGAKNTYSVNGIKAGFDASVTLTNRLEVKQYKESTKTVGSNNINLQVGPSTFGYSASAEHTSKSAGCTCDEDDTYDEIIACPERIISSGITPGYGCLEYEAGLYVGIGMDFKIGFDVAYFLPEFVDILHDGLYYN